MDFADSLARRLPPPEFSPALKALWFAAKDDWSAAHDIVMAHDDADCAWVHAHLHRIEGDAGNANYWYRQASKRAATGAFDAERAAIVATLMKPRLDGIGQPRDASSATDLGRTMDAPAPSKLIRGATGDW